MEQSVRAVPLLDSTAFTEHPNDVLIDPNFGMDAVNNKSKRKAPMLTIALTLDCLFVCLFFFFQD